MTHSIASRRYAGWLWLLLLLFAFRVVAQPLALVVHSPLLPPFESWHSAALPYGVLLASQVVILLGLAFAAWRVGSGAVAPSRRVGAAALGLGGSYFAVMVARLILGFTLFRGVRWFASPVPTVFHLVLASWLLVYGRFHYLHGARHDAGR